MAAQAGPHSANPMTTTMSPEQRITAAVALAHRYAQSEGADAKAWVIDQMVRRLLDDGYDEFVTRFRNGEDGPNSHDWDVGLAP